MLMLQLFRLANVYTSAYLSFEVSDYAIYSAALRCIIRKEESYVPAATRLSYREFQPPAAE